MLSVVILIIFVFVFHVGLCHYCYLCSSSPFLCSFTQILILSALLSFHRVPGIFSYGLLPRIRSEGSMPLIKCTRYNLQIEYSPINLGMTYKVSERGVCFKSHTITCACSNRRLFNVNRCLLPNQKFNRRHIHITNHL